MISISGASTVRRKLGRAAMLGILCVVGAAGFAGMAARVHAQQLGQSPPGQNPAGVLPAPGAPELAPPRAGQPGEDQQSLRRELADLARQQARITARMAAIQAQLAQRDARSAVGRIRDEIQAFQPGAQQQLTPQERKAVESALRSAREAMATARKALEQAAKSWPGLLDIPDLGQLRLPPLGSDSMGGSRLGIAPFVGQPVPGGIPGLPPSGDGPIIFGKPGPGGAPPGAPPDGEVWFRQNPAFEKAMRDFQAHMEAWSQAYARQLEQQLRQQLGNIPPPKGEGSGYADGIDDNPL